MAVVEGPAPGRELMAAAEAGKNGTLRGRRDQWVVVAWPETFGGVRRGHMAAEHGEGDGGDDARVAEGGE